MVREVLVSRTEPSNVPSEIAVPEQPLYFYFKISPSFGLGYGPETSVPMAVHRHARAHPTRRRPFPTTDSRPDRCGDFFGSKSLRSPLPSATDDPAGHLVPKDLAGYGALAQHDVMELREVEAVPKNLLRVLA